MRIPLRRGRDFTSGDTFEAAMVTVVNEAFARAAFGGDDPIGQRVHVGFDRDGDMTIVGVVADIRTAGPERPPEPEIFMPYEQHPGPSTGLTLVVRSDTADLDALAATITRLIRARNPQVPVVAETMNGVLAQATATPRFRTYVLIAFASVALLLALTGVYGVMAFNVSQRVAEIGLRMALGATPRNIVGLVVGHGSTVIAAGVAAGLALSLALSRLMNSFLFEVAPRDPLLLGGVVAAVAAAGIAASAAPALAALRGDPIAALRGE
jgi:ABC-type antimicrobial peptide transport system permease subunit